MRLFPRDEKFFDLLVDLANHLVSAAQQLNDAANKGTNAAAREAAEAIRRTEQEADTLTQQLFTRLNSTFVTPLDPEDLHALGQSLDDVVDYVEDASFFLATYKIDPVPRVTELTENGLAACKKLQSAVKKLQSGDTIADDCLEIVRIENKGDDIYRRLIGELFDHERDPIALIKYKDIYEALESATDRCVDVADVLLTIQVKNS
jgi:predicted phosphate transport protein (TIGR00153 family)